MVQNILDRASAEQNAPAPRLPWGDSSVAPYTFYLPALYFGERLLCFTIGWMVLVPQSLACVDSVAEQAVAWHFQTDNAGNHCARVDAHADLDVTLWWETEQYR